MTSQDRGWMPENLGSCEGVLLVNLRGSNI